MRSGVLVSALFILILATSCITEKDFDQPDSGLLPERRCNDLNCIFESWKMCEEAGGVIEDARLDHLRVRMSTSRNCTLHYEVLESPDFKEVGKDLYCEKSDDEARLIREVFSVQNNYCYGSLFDLVDPSITRTAGLSSGIVFTDIVVDSNIIVMAFASSFERIYIKSLDVQGKGLEGCRLDFSVPVRVPKDVHQTLKVVCEAVKVKGSRVFGSASLKYLKDANSFDYQYVNITFVARK